MIDSDVLNNDVTLTAVMEPKSFTITIKSNNSNNQTKTYSAKYGEDFILPSCPFSAVTNYTFNNYTCDGTTHSVGGKFTVTGDMSVTCNWTYHAPAPANKFSIKFSITHTTDTNYAPCIAEYCVKEVTGSYKNKEIGIRVYWGGDRGYKTSITVDKPTIEGDFGYWLGGLSPEPLGEINKIELRDGFEGAVLATKNVTLIKNGVTNVTMTLS